VVVNKVEQAQFEEDINMLLNDDVSSIIITGNAKNIINKKRVEAPHPMNSSNSKSKKMKTLTTPK